MRISLRLLTLIVLGTVPAVSLAQDGTPLKITSVRVGFKAYEPNRSYHKSGMWAPVEVRLTAGDRIDDARLMLEINDNEDTPTVTTAPIPLLEAGERVVRSYVLPGNMSSDLRVRVKTRDRTFEKDDGATGRRIEPSKLLFLTLGAKFPDFHRSLRQLRVADENQAAPQGRPGAAAVEPGEDDSRQDSDEISEHADTGNRLAAYETDAGALPDSYHGYQAVDLIILSTEHRDFFMALMEKEPSRLRALAQWIHRGGHMVVSVHWKNQAEVARFFQHPVWQPAIPVQLSSSYEPARDPKRLQSVEHFAALNKPFENNKQRIPIAQLREIRAPLADWNVRADLPEKDSDPLPIIARMPYGLGSITFLAFAVDPGSPFSQWEGRTDFWRSLIRYLVPDVRQAEGAQAQQYNRAGGAIFQDIVTKLHKELDVFDVEVVPFGLVALLILIYIIIVGPIDYVVLKYVFKRLEWTWISFPMVICAVSLAAYLTANAIKGKELRINQVDVVDIDMRTEVNEHGQPKNAYVYGQTFFGLLSPKIKHYTIGVQPNVLFFEAAAQVHQPEARDNSKPASGFQSADLVYWLGKGGREFGGVEGRGSQSYFRRAYHINSPANEAVGLVGVPISVWSSKAFTASWDAVLPKLPLHCALHYHGDQLQAETFISGELGNNLPVDLEDVWLFYKDQVYGVADVIRSGERRQLALPLPQQSKTKKANTWVSHADLCDEVARTASDRGAVYNPTLIIKQAYMFDRAQGPTSSECDQFLRRLDQCWRLQDEVKRERDVRLHEAILYARVRYRSGPARELCADDKHPLPTHIWLGKLPGAGAAAPELTGQLNHDTYLRFILPVPPRRR